MSGIGRRAHLAEDYMSNPLPDPSAFDFVNDPSLRRPRRESLSARLRKVLAFLLFTAGVLGIVVGGLLYLGNRTGRLPTFPFAGGITLTVGGVLCGVACTLWDWRPRR